MTRQYRRYDEGFKKSIVNLYHNGKTQTELAKEYGISITAINKWVKLYSEVKIDSDTILTAKQVQQLQKRNALLEEENCYIKKSDCHIHASLKQRLDAIHKLKSQHHFFAL